MLNYPWKLSLVTEVTGKSGFSMLQQTYNPLGTINNDTIHKIIKKTYSTHILLPFWALSDSKNPKYEVLVTYSI